MSKKSRALEKHKKQNSPKAKAKREKKAFYDSPKAKQQWEDKKAKKAKKQAETYGYDW